MYLNKKREAKDIIYCFLNINTSPHASCIVTPVWRDLSSDAILFTLFVHEVTESEAGGEI